MAVRQMRFKFQSYGQSETGLVREHNEDAWGAVPDLGFFVVADGMGGHQAGEVASRMTVDSLCESMKQVLKDRDAYRSKADMTSLLKLAIVEANQKVYKAARQDPSMKGMGTTLCCLLFFGGQVMFAHLGDSRIYRIREGILEQVTADHSLYQQLQDSGEIRKMPREDFRYKNIVTKCIGTGLLVDPSIQVDYVRDGDVFMMCTDGLTDMLDNGEIEEIMQDCPGLEAGVNALMDAALIRGGTDNVSIVMVRAEEEAETGSG